MSDVTEKLLQLVSKKFNVQPTSLQPGDDVFEKLQINSVQALALLSDLEKEFKIEIPDYELQDVRTFQDLAQLIQNRQ